MGTESITDTNIELLIATQKQVKNPNARQADKGSHIQTNYRVVSLDGEEFMLYVRQNNRITEDFSCGLLWHMPSGDALTLVRYNGFSHFHSNRIEKSEIDYECHIHRATERYLSAGLKAEGFAESASTYTTIKGALHQLTTDCKINGLDTEPDHPDLFS